MTDTTLIVPPHSETALTGFRLGAERKLRGSLWRVEFWNDAALPRVFKNGTRQELETLPVYAINFANGINTKILSHF
jgi:hypothetical protein